MPAKHVIKPYVAGAIYHIYNRGINKSNIFLDNQDYHIFLSYLKFYLTPRDTQRLESIIADSSTPYSEKNKALRELQLENFFKRIELMAYCLMPNHFHLLIKQIGERDIVSWMRALITRYTAYGNRRHNHLGPLLHGNYRAVLVRSDEQFLYLTRYIHRNPLSLKRSNLFSQPSSYPDYLGKRHQDWVKSGEALVNFSKTGFTSYQAFVELADSSLEDQALNILGKATIDN